jgi:hypothetical protein
MLSSTSSSAWALAPKRGSWFFFSHIMRYELTFITT